MLIKNTDNPNIGFAKFALFCDHCGEEIGDEPANAEFTELGEIYCLHKQCSRAFRALHKPKKFYWAQLERLRLDVKEGFAVNSINLKR